MVKYSQTPIGRISGNDARTAIGKWLVLVSYLISRRIIEVEAVKRCLFGLNIKKNKCDINKDFSALASK